MNAYGGYPTPLPYNQGPGAYVVGPSLRGAGSTYSYVQQNNGAGMGMSPNAYYSMNYFTATPMTYVPSYRPVTGGSYSSRYVAPSSPTQAVPSGYYATTPTTSPVYSSANTTYYNNSRGGPLRRIFGRR